MPGALEAIDDVLTGVDGGGVTASEAIEQLLGAQITLRNNRRLQAAMRSSRLPGIKTLDDFDFSFQPSIKREQIDSLHELGFLERKENVIFLGPPGVGKTHLAISLAIAAAQSGRRVYYGALADLITSLEEAKTTGQLGRRLKILTYPSLLVIDEIGYLPVSQTGAMLFFQLINRRYERASTVLTSNKGFEEWGQILGDEVMAVALIDRLLHHCHIVNIRGSSYRMRKHTDLSKILHSPPAESTPSPPKRKESKSKGENDELEARHLRQVCNFRWPDLCSFRWPLTALRISSFRKPWVSSSPWDRIHAHRETGLAGVRIRWVSSPQRPSTCTGTCIAAGSHRWPTGETGSVEGLLSVRGRQGINRRPPDSPGASSSRRRHRAELALSRLSSTEPSFSQLGRSGTSTSVSRPRFTCPAEHSHMRQLLDPAKSRCGIFPRAGCFFSYPPHLPLE